MNIYMYIYIKEKVRIVTIVRLNYRMMMYVFIGDNG